MATIYKITNLLNGKFYIGATSKNIGYRMGLHKHSAFKLNSGSEFYSAIREFGWINFAISEIETCRKKQMFKREAFWISSLNSMWPNGYNTESSHLSGAVQSDIVKDKKSIAQLERFKDPRQRKKHSISLKKMFKNPEIKENHRLGLVNSWTDERRAEYSEKAKQNVNLINSKGQEKAVEKRRIKVQLFNTETNEVETFKSLTDCASQKQWSIASISKQLKNGGFLFKKYLVKLESDETTFDEMLINAYAKKEETVEKMSRAKIGKRPWNYGITCEPLSEETKSKLRKAQGKKVVCINDGLVFESTQMAAKYYGLYDGSSVSRVCRGLLKSCKGLVFKYNE